MNFNNFPAFSDWNEVKCKNCDHMFVKPGPSEDVWTLSLQPLCSNSFHRTRQMLIHEKICSLNDIHVCFSGTDKEGIWW